MRGAAYLSAAVVTLAFVAPVAASCRIKNETKYSFTVESGNTSNQSVGSNTETSIASGKVIGKSKDGKSFGGQCGEGQSVKVVEENGVVMMVPR
jgi:hypothetical protein